MATRAHLRSLLELLGVTGIAIAQPVLDVLGNSADTFIARGADRRIVIAIAATVAFAPAVALWAVELVTATFSPRTSRRLHLVFLAAGAGVIALEIAKRNTAWSSWLLLVVAVLAAVLAAFAIVRLPAVRLWARYLAAAAFVFVLLFLLATPVNDVLFNPSGRVVHVRAARPAPIVLIVLDEFPEVSLLDGQGHVDRGAFPHFAELADESTWYRNSTTVALFTRNAVPAILTGQFPHHPNESPTVKRHPENIFTLLGGEYRVNAHERVTQLCPARLCSRPSDELAAYSSMMGEAFRILGRRALPRRYPANNPVLTSRFVAAEAPGIRFREFLDSIHPSSQPSLNVLHVELPHTRWRFLGSGQSYDIGKQDVGEGIIHGIWLDDSYATAARLRHLLQVQFADLMIGNTISDLKRKGMWDKSVVVVTADHGAAFTGGAEFRDFDRKSISQTLWTPLFIKAPGQRAGAVSDIDARSIDVVPTIADLIGVKVPWKLDGRSLLGPRPDLHEHSVIRFDGKRERVDGRPGFRAVLRGGIPKGRGDPSYRLFQGGRYGYLVGTRVETLARGPPPRFTARIDDPGALGTVNPSAPTLPLYVNGAVDTFPAGDVVLSLNGVIAGWSELHGQLALRDGVPIFVHKFRTFNMTLPPQLLRRHNDVALFLVDGAPGSERLRPLRLGGTF